VAAAGRRRLSFKDKHALETLPGTIAKLQQEAASLQLRLDDPNFYVKDRASFEKTTASIGEIHQKIAAAEERWLALEIQREDIEGPGPTG
jgi:ATP-binding cassette subfamily F protein uup